MIPSYQGIQGAFFRAMREGYATGVLKTSIQELPCSNLITYDEERFKVVDFYFTNSGSAFSSGMTIIYFDGKPVWSMAYQGWYEQHDISFLKQALLDSYRKGHFIGGRGPARLEAEDGRAYINQFEGSFAEFSGEEQILNQDGSRSGQHMYQGGFLILIEPDSN